MSEPAEQPTNPTLRISWDQEAQSVGFKFETKEFKNWSFVIMLLEGALEEARFQASLARANAMQKMAMENAQNQALARQLKLGRA